MSIPGCITRHVVATVHEVLPSTGLAYAVDDADRSWGITRNTQGVGLAQLSPGQRVELTVDVHTDFELVSGYAPLD